MNIDFFKDLICKAIEALFSFIAACTVSVPIAVPAYIIYKDGYVFTGMFIMGVAIFSHVFVAINFYFSGTED